MSRLVINGGKPLCGVVRIQGAKNSVLPIMAASLLSDGECVISGCPNISDADNAVRILEDLGACTERYADRISINASNAFKCVIPDVLMRKMRSSIVFLGAIVSKCGRARVSFPGGCEIGCRPIDLHISSLEKMNISVVGRNGYLECRTDGIKGADINLTFPSVGATENIMLAACRADGKTVIENAAREPEIVDLQNFINAMGGRVSGAGTSRIEIFGVKRLRGVTYRIIPDRIVAATYLCAVAATRGCALLKDVNPEDLSAVVSLLRDAGCDISVYDDSISIDCEKTERIKSIDSVRTMPYPGFPTDAEGNDRFCRDRFRKPLQVRGRTSAYGRGHKDRRACCRYRRRRKVVRNDRRSTGSQRRSGSLCRRCRRGGNDRYRPCGICAPRL